MKFLKYITAIFFVLQSSLASASGDYFDDMVSELLTKRINDERIIAEPSYSSASRISKIKEGHDKIKSVIIEKFEPQYSAFVIKILYNDGKSENIAGKYISFIALPVAARYIKFGEVIQPSDLSAVKTRLENVRSGYVTEKAEVIGMQARQYIQAGSMFKSSNLVRPAVIKSGDPVNLIFSSGTINLKTVGLSLGNGAVGDMIKVRNESSGAVLLGQIINKNTVQIGGE